MRDRTCKEIAPEFLGFIPGQNVCQEAIATGRQIYFICDVKEKTRSPREVLQEREQEKIPAPAFCETGYVGKLKGACVHSIKGIFCCRTIHNKVLVRNKIIG
ncbi:MAG: hypothetical protein DDT33_00908 [Firmicutes bacterium]|nr:hypothetical protein [Bacillota bacterium]